MFWRVHKITYFVLYFIQLTKAYTNIGLIWKLLAILVIYFLLYVITIPWSMGFIKETVFFGSTDESFLNEWHMPLSHWIWVLSFSFKRLPVAKNWHEISILAFGAGVCCNVIFLCLDGLWHPHFPLGASCNLSVHWAEKWFQHGGFNFSLACSQNSQNAFLPADVEHSRLLVDRFYDW